jgi:membrane protease YdiL (CAAX protease family)
MKPIGLDLSEEKNLFDKLKNVFAVFGAYTVYAFLVYHVIFWFMPELSSQMSLYKFAWSTFFTICVLAPLTEELFWRFIPIKIMLMLDFPKKLMWLIMLGISACFGWYHNGAVTVIAQGVFGVMLSWLYIKNDSYWLNVLAHFLWNFFVYMGFLFFVSC